MTSDADNPRSDRLSRTNRVQRSLDPFAHCTALLKVYVWLLPTAAGDYVLSPAANGSDSPCAVRLSISISYRQIRKSARSSSRQLPGASTVIAWPGKDSQPLLQFSMIAAMQSLDSELATDRRSHSIPSSSPARPGPQGSAACGWHANQGMHRNRDRSGGRENAAQTADCSLGAVAPCWLRDLGARKCCHLLSKPHHASWAIARTL